MGMQNKGVFCNISRTLIFYTLFQNESKSRKRNTQDTGHRRKVKESADESEEQSQGDASVCPRPGGQPSRRIRDYE